MRRRVDRRFLRVGGPLVLGRSVDVEFSAPSDAHGLPPFFLHRSAFMGSGELKVELFALLCAV